MLGHHGQSRIPSVADIDDREQEQRASERIEANVVPVEEQRRGHEHGDIGERRKKTLVKWMITGLMKVRVPIRRSAVR